ncbi:MAG: SDR family NAD(P)-dependent oxidoreductase, partial [Silvanigrellaceae bacterium]|nr:SDR family NAD(P)-dependent oxidoreductase [Silvanigrellaceae bacterium]
KLDKQIAVITGGASGLGKACAQLLSSHNVEVVVWDKNPEEQMTAKGIHFFACDIRSEAEVERAMQETLSTIGVPRIGINCAGIAPAKRMVGKEGAMPLQAFKEVIDVNLVGSFNVMRVLAAAMIQADHNNDITGGVIINTASIAAFEGQIGQLAYSASKGGIVSMTLPAARELAQHAIRVNTIAPGLMATPMLLSMPEEVQKSLAATVTFPQRLGRPEEFAQLVKHIIENDFINGEVIRLDGALRMQAR